MKIESNKIGQFYITETVVISNDDCDYIYFDDSPYSDTVYLKSSNIIYHVYKNDDFYLVYSIGNKRPIYVMTEFQFEIFKRYSYKLTEDDLIIKDIIE